MIGPSLPDSDFVDLSADFDECGHGPSIPLGLKDGKHVDVRMVANGKGCGCVCPTCKRPLVAVQGEQRQYFRHHRRSDCETGHETGVHGLAKELLAESLSLFIPAAIARHGDLIPCILRQGREWSFQSASLEKTLVDGDKRRIRPDLILKGEFRGEPLELLVEIQVRHKQERWKINEIRERGLAAIEIDLSKEPPTATRDYYRRQILEKAERHWLVNRRIDEARQKIREYWERKYGRIAERIEAACAEAPLSTPDKWVEPVVAAGLEELIGIEISGGACFTTSARIWQAAILHRYILASPEENFDPGKALSWLQRERLLKPAFARLLQSRDRRQRAHVEDCLKGIFHDPRKVLSRYAGELVQRGQFQKREGGRGWRASPEIGHAARERHEEYIRWRIRHGKLHTEYNAIKNRAIHGAEMDWDAWLRTPLSAYRGTTPGEFLAADEDRFEALLAHLKELRAMLDPGAAVAADLLELRLEPERDARLAEQQKVREEAARREAKWQARVEAARQAAEQQARGETERRAQQEAARRAEEAARIRARDGAAARARSGPAAPPPEPPPVKKVRRRPLAGLREWMETKWTSLWSG